MVSKIPYTNTDAFLQMSFNLPLSCCNPFFSFYLTLILPSSCWCLLFDWEHFIPILENPQQIPGQHRIKKKKKKTPFDLSLTPILSFWMTAPITHHHPRKSSLQTSALLKPHVYLYVSGLSPLISTNLVCLPKPFTECLAQRRPILGHPKLGRNETRTDRWGI